MSDVFAERVRALGTAVEQPDWDDVLARRRRFVTHRRRVRIATAVTVVAGFGALVVGGGHAVGWSAFDRWTNHPNGPKRIGDRVEITSDGDWAVYAWTSTRGICMGLSIHDEPSSSSCGFPVVGAPPDTVFTQRLPENVVGISGATPGGDDPSSYVMGPISPSVARVEVVLRDGRVLEAGTFESPSALETSLRFYALRIPDPPPIELTGGKGPPRAPVAAVRAYDAAGVRLGTLIWPPD